MGVILPKSIFFHIPKTGGSWVDESLKNAFGDKYIKMNLEVGWPADVNGIHIPPTKVEYKHFAFTFVRHPLAWYQSYWRFNHDKFVRDKDKPLLTGSVSFAEQYDGQNVLGDYCGDTEFYKFIDNVIEKFPYGYYNVLVREFENVDFVGRQEMLYFDLCKALEKAGEDFNEYDFLAQHVNVSPNNLPSGYTKEQEEAILKMESYVIDKYYGSSSSR